jgi:hypothetical protein
MRTKNLLNLPRLSPLRNGWTGVVFKKENLILENQKFTLDFFRKTFCTLFLEIHAILAKLLNFLGIALVATLQFAMLRFQKSKNSLKTFSENL